MSTAKDKMDAALAAEREKRQKQEAKERQREEELTQLRNKEFRVLTPAQCALDDERPYVIKGLLAQGDVAGVIGAPGSGKSVLAPLAGYAVTQGNLFLGRRVRQGCVLYFAAEDGHGMKMRVRALRQRFGDSPDFKLIPDTLDLYDDESGHVSKVCALIIEHEPVLVIIDTIARSFPGLNENASESMSRVVMVLRMFASQKCRPAIIAMHHVAKDNGATPRGHGVLHGDLDAVLFIQGEKAEPRQVSMTKNRNGPSDAAFAFNIETEDFGLDDDGDAITAPIAAPIEGPSPTRKAAVEASLNDKQSLMLREVRDLIDRYGEPVQPSPGYPQVRGVSRKLLKSRLIDRCWFPDHLLLQADDGKQKLTRQGLTAENNGLTALKRRNLVNFDPQHVWLV